MFGKKKHVTKIEKGHGREIFDNFMRNKLAVVAAIILIIILLVRPTGILGKKRREKV